MSLVGYLAAIIMGSVLGLIGGGGSILTVPILVYLLQVDAVAATGYSLFIVGVSALFGAVGYARQGLVDFKTGIVFAIPAFMGVYSARKFVVPSLPEIIFDLGAYEMSKSAFILAFFAVIMVLASISMIRKPKASLDSTASPSDKHFNYPLIAIEGIVVGGITGFVGAGGGFLIIPALVVFAKLDMKVAVGTSLMIIAIKSLIGFIGDIERNPNIEWSFLAIFTVLSIIGIFIGSYFSQKVSSKKLKPAFGWFVLVMGTIMLLKELA